MFIKLGILVGLAALVGGAYLSGLLAYANPERLRAALDAAGPWGPLLFIALFAVAELVHVPGVIFVLGASLAWPPAMAIVVSYVGAMLAAVTVFSVARLLVGEALQRYLPARFRAYNERLETHGLTTVIVIRLVFFLAPWVHFALGASRVGLRDFVLGTAVGLAPGVVILGLLGAGVQRWGSDIPTAAWIMLAAVVVVLLLWRRQRR